jgi:FkbM family methyltransferase
VELLQKILLEIYSFFKKSGLTESRWFQKVFWLSYFIYKEYLEDPFSGLIKKRPELFQGGHILDIGANIGYTSTLFSKVVTPGFKIYAFEPEKTNFIQLNQIIDNWKVKSKIIPLHAAVGTTDGTVELWYNENHHGDHRVVTKEYGEAGIDLMKVSVVEMRCIDSFVKSEMIESAIKFIKIDVQGYELPVCLGMEQTLAANSNAVVAIEYAPSSISELGFEPKKLLDFFQDKNYFMYLLGRSGNLKPMQDEAIEKMVTKRGYIDLICSKKKLVL